MIKIMNNLIQGEEEMTNWRRILSWQYQKINMKYFKITEKCGIMGRELTSIQEEEMQV